MNHGPLKTRAWITRLLYGVTYIIKVCLLFVLVTGCGHSSNSGSAPEPSGETTGKGGSMARFSIVNDYLYAIAGPDIQLFDISTPTNPTLWNRVTVNFDIETLFSYENQMFVGGETGLYIYDVSDPRFPKYVAKFNHARNCDPVVVQGKYAYVTLRSNNTRCFGSNNQLDIIDISVIEDPFLVKSYPMQEPNGLGVDTEKLFLCDGDAGLKVFDISDPNNITLLDYLSGISCYDVIPNNNLLIISGDDALLQFDYSEVPLRGLSSIQIVADRRGGKY